MNNEELDDAVDALSAYDAGATDSGTHDPVLRDRVRHHLAELDDGQFDVVATEIAHRLYLTPEARSLGYTEEDADEVIEWMSDLRKESTS